MTKDVHFIFARDNDSVWVLFDEPCEVIRLARIESNNVVRVERDRGSEGFSPKEYNRRRIKFFGVFNSTGSEMVVVSANSTEVVVPSTTYVRTYTISSY